jgi:transposase InsO family protein
MVASNEEATMAWKVVTTMSQRQEFVRLASQEGANVRDLCRRYEISAPTGYKWLGRYASLGLAGLADRSSRPQRSPAQTPAVIEQAVLAVRLAHPTWGGRKIKAYLERAGHCGVPAASTITAILRRQGQVDAQEARKHCAFQRFEQAAPNALWQMDFKGHFALENGQRCHPLTVLDDHSRFLLGLQACANETTTTVQAHLTALFRTYGLPERILCDHGSPWGSSDAAHPYTPITVWLLRLGVLTCHGRPYHPQTQGKDERLHRTLKQELLNDTALHNLARCQHYFDAWRQVYNEHRPHQALDLQVPAERDQPSRRAFPESLPPILYPPGDPVRKVQAQGEISFQGRQFLVGRAFFGYSVALRSVATDQFDVYFCDYPVGHLSLADALPDQA